MAAATADVVFAASASIENAQKYYASVKGRMAKFGRPTSELHIMPGIMAVVGRTEQEAQDKYGELQDLIDPKVGLSQLAASLGDLSAYDLDGPVPEDKINPRMRSRAALMLDMARRQNLTIRQLYLAVAAGNGHHVAVGSAQQVADVMEHWFTHRGRRRLQLRAGGAARRHPRFRRSGGAGVAAARAVPHRIRRRHASGKSRPAEAAGPARGAADGKSGIGMRGQEWALVVRTLLLLAGFLAAGRAGRGAGQVSVPQHPPDRQLSAGRRYRRGRAAVRRQDDRDPRPARRGRESRRRRGPDRRTRGRRRRT